MAQTVIGFFKDAADAQKAVERLAEKGISRQNVDISRGEYKDGTADLDGRNTNKVTDFFNKLFGHDSDDAKRYSTFGQSNVTIVTVHAASKDMAEEAADVLDDSGAVDVDEDGTQSGHGTTGTGLNSDRDTLNQSGSTQQSGTMGTGARRRSRIIDRSIEDDYRLRGL